MDQDCSVKPPFSQLEDSKGGICNQLREVLPANRSSLTSYKDKSVKLKFGSELLINEKKLLVSERKATQFQNCGISDLPGNSTLDEEPSNQLITPCFTKKRRVHTDLEIEQHDENYELSGLTASINPMGCENLQGSNNVSAQSSQVAVALLPKDSRTIKKRDVEILDQKDKAVQSGIVLSANEETRGSEFLTQVRSFSIINTLCLV